MTDSVSFKAYLKRGGQEVEVRRFGVDGGAATNYMYLRGKIQSVFPSIQNDQFTVFWQDNDNDYITIGSDEELVVALTSTNIQPFKLYVKITAQQHQSPGGSSQQIHPGVTCDGCENSLVGFRYKCVTCFDFDLCSSCETAGVHPEHFMIRFPNPIDRSHYNEKIFRKVFRPHKFHKKHGWNRKVGPHAWNCHEDMHGEGQSVGGTSHCPFNKREGPVPGMTDMFDFSALLEFINSLGINAAGECGVQESATTAQATSSSQGQPCQATSSQESNKSTSQAHIGPLSESKLHEIGNAITALLGPFDMTIEEKGKLMKNVLKVNSYRDLKQKKYAPSNKHFKGHHRFGQKHVHGIRHLHGHHNSRLFRGHGHDFVPAHGFYLKQRPGFVTRDEFGSLIPLVNLSGDDEIGIDLTFDVQTKSTSGQKPATSATSQQNTPAAPQQNAATTSQQNAAATPGQNGSTSPPEKSWIFPQQNTPATSQQNTSATPQQNAAATPQQNAAATSGQNGQTGNPQAEAIPMPTPDTSAIQSAESASATARRNSDDWTLINRESPTRSEEVAMDVDESRGAKAKSAYPELPKETPSAPPQPDIGLSDSERQRIQAAIDMIRAMGFTFDTTVLKELLRKENYDIASVLEMILSNTGKK